MLVTLVTLSSFVGLCYYFRMVMMRMFITVFFNVFRYVIICYSYMKKPGDKMNRLEYKLLDDCVVDKYYVTDSGKSHTLVFVASCNNTLYGHITDFKRDIKRSIKNKNMIVHCSISDDSDNIVMDLTELFRRFCYYYDKNHTLHGFFKYVDEHRKEFKKNMEGVNIYDYNLSIYLNDDSFNEICYSIRDILDTNKKFSELLINNDPLEQQ